MLIFYHKVLYLSTPSGLADVDRSHLSKIELGLRNPTIIVLDKIANAIGINTSDIIKKAE
jgi:transcriptional regulator with XRE-family HTH domain